MFSVSDLERDFKFVSDSLTAACRTLAAGSLLATAATGGGQDLVENLFGSPVGQQTVLENRQIRLTLMTPFVF